MLLVQKAYGRADVKSTAGQNLLQVRTYDCLISYDKHYQTPRFWLFGYDEVSSHVPRSITAHGQNKNPLTPAQVFQDVPADHAFKTMTMEAFPHSGQQLASVHPCKHASVMKKFIDRMELARADASGVVPEKTVESDGKRKWGLGGVMRKVTGGATPAEKEKKPEEDEAPEGVQVDFYLVIVSDLSRCARAAKQDQG